VKTVPGAALWGRRHEIKPAVWGRERPIWSASACSRFCQGSLLPPHRDGGTASKTRAAAEPDQSLRHRFQHFGPQVLALEDTLALLLEHGLQPLQIDFAGRTRQIMAPGEPLDFGTGTLFVRNPDGNLVEFLQMGRGFFSLALGDGPG
jgi:hypothetical protein